MKSNTRRPAIDAYIAKSQPFAQPILTHLRELVHRAAPDVREEMKWSMPFFVLDGVFLASMAAFKAHCTFSIWGKQAAARLKADGHFSKEAMGVLGKISSLDGLPGDKDLLAYLKSAAAEIADGTRTTSYSRPKPGSKPEPAVPAELTAALEKNKSAQNHFDAFPPSHRKEYIQWITEAKRDETRIQRIAQAIEWIAEGKSRNWKYE